MSRDPLGSLLLVVLGALAGVATAGAGPPAVAVVATEVAVKPLTSERVFSPPRRLGERPYVVTVLLAEAGSGDVTAPRPLVLFAGERETASVSAWGRTVAIAASIDREGRRAEVEVSVGEAGRAPVAQRFLAWLPNLAEGAAGRPPGLRPAGPSASPAPDPIPTPTGEREPQP